MSRGEFSIVMANLAAAGGLMAIIQPFSAIYVLILAVLGPLMTKESKLIYGLLDKVFRFEARKAVKPKQKGNSNRK